jgi:hypothetical protein
MIATDQLMSIFSLSLFLDVPLLVQEKIKDKLLLYANCLRASVSKLADTMEAHT